MKTIIAGSRDIYFKDFNEFINIIEGSGIDIDVILSGTARGIDQYGERYARLMGIELEQYPADWAKYGKPAGVIRNKEMLDNAEALIAIWDGKSNGTKNMITIAKNKGIKVFVKII